jgi:hypothetical protein
MSTNKKLTGSVVGDVRDQVTVERISKTMGAGGAVITISA